MSNYKKDAKNNTTKEFVPEKKKLSEVIYENLVTVDNDRTRFIEGKLLTLIDAIFSDPEQRKAVKDNVQCILSENRGRLEMDRSEVCTDMYVALRDANANERDDENDPYFVRKRYSSNQERSIRMDYKMPSAKDVDLTR